MRSEQKDPDDGKTLYFGRLLKRKQIWMSLCRPPLYKAVWYWDDEHFLTYTALEKPDKHARLQPQALRPTYPRHSVAGKTLQFLENVDQNQQKVFKQRYQRPARNNVPSVVTLQDVKDVVTFLMVGKVPRGFLALVQCHRINQLFRALILYFQLYLQVWDDLKYRRLAYADQRLKHPIASVRENLCRSYLSKLRSKIGQEYGQLIAGEGSYKRHHHMNNPLNRSYTATDNQLYEYLVKFCARLVWTALYRSNYKEIEMEMSRLFQLRNTREDAAKRSVETVVTEADRGVLQGEKQTTASHWNTVTPVIADIFNNDHDPGLLLPQRLRVDTTASRSCLELSGLDALLELPEELLSRCRLTLGVLGQPRDDFEVMLHVKQAPAKNLEEQELDRALAHVTDQVEKPKVKMYQYLHDLESTIDLNDLQQEEDNVTIDIIEEIKFYLANHVEDSKRSYNIWMSIKGK